MQATARGGSDWQNRAKLVITIHRFDYLSGKWGWFARTCLRAAEQMSLRVPDAVIAVAPFLKAHYQAQGHKVEYIPNGVPLPPFNIGASHLHELGLEPGQYVLFLGRLVPEKRPDWTIRAFREMSDGAMRLVVAGGSSATDQYVRELKALAQSAGERILLPGHVTSPLKEELMAHARLFVLPSALEGLPITLLEAMSYGRSCLVSDIPPHRDVLRDGENGFLHRADDFQQFHDTLQKLLLRPIEQLVKVGIAGRQIVAPSFDWEDIVDQVEALYTKMQHSTLKKDVIVEAPKPRKEGGAPVISDAD